MLGWLSIFCAACAGVCVVISTGDVPLGFAVVFGLYAIMIKMDENE